MALPLKSGADLYNQQALRMRLHNLGADPTEVGAGLIYYNTSSGLSTSQQIRFHTGTAWKTLAFAEDLDVASNADFLALKSKVDAFLEGGVDSDGVLENLKEIQAFLDNYSSATDLSEILDTKLDKAGGTMSGNITMGTNAIVFSNTPSSDWANPNNSGLRILNSVGSAGANAPSAYGVGLSVSGAYGFQLALAHSSSGFDFKMRSTRNGTDTPYDWVSLYHTGNFNPANYLPLTGGTINGASGNYTPLIVKTTSLSEVWIAFEDTVGVTHIGSVRGVPSIDSGNGNKTLLHSGNVGDYNAGGLISYDLSDFGTHTARYWTNWGETVDIGFGQFSYGFYVGSNDPNYSFVIGQKANADGLKFRQKRSTWEEEKTIAFTDSTVDKAKKLVADNNATYAEYTEGTVYIGSETYSTANAVIMGNAINLRYGGGTNGLILNSSGNVTIGSEDLAGTNYTLRTIGSIASPLYYFVNRQHEQHGYIGLASSGNNDIYLNSVSGRIRLNSEQGIILNDSNGNVLIGTTTDNGAKLQVKERICVQADQFNNAGVQWGLSQTTGENWLLSARGEETGKHFRAYYYNGSKYVSVLDLVPNGNVLIGRTEDDGSGAKLQVVGDLHVTGNIIADGEVSAGGAGTEGGNTGGGSGAFYSTTIATQTTSKAIAHNLGTEDIVVSIYEKNGTSGNWEMILTDVEIEDANNIVVSFGSATNVEHKVVIMGAVA